MQGVDVIIFGGQSNMQGESESCSDHSVVLNAWEYKYLSDTLVPLKNPVGENIRPDKTEGVPVVAGTQASQWVKEHTLGAACYGNTSLIPSFCRAYCEQTGKNVVAIPAARGGTLISHWLSGTVGYEVLKEKVQAGLKKAKQEFFIERIYFVWLQGESDAVVGSSRQYYKDMLNVLQESLEKDIHIEKFCLIRVGKFAGDERDWEIMHAQSEICRENPKFIMLTEIAADLCEQAEYMNPNVAGHYSAAGLEILGKAAGAVLASQQ